MKEYVIKLAREAGFAFCEESYKHQPNCLFHGGYAVDALLERFAALVADAEREVCAKYFDDHWRETWTDEQIAEAIRSKGKAKDEMPLFDDWNKKW
jgi:hypothetical protein